MVKSVVSNVDNTYHNVSRIIRAIQNSTSPKLASINTLLQAVVQLAQVVVKGTNSQQRFNALFSEFCRAALVGIADLEVAVYALERSDGLVEQDVHAEDDVKGIKVTEFVKEVAGFVASQTNTLGAQYLEHVGMSAILKTSDTQTTVAGKNRVSKRTRTEDVKQQNFSGRSLPLKRARNAACVDSPAVFDTLQQKSVHNGGDSAGVYNGIPKLCSIVELSTWLQPWNIPLPAAHGVALDRVTTERLRTSYALGEVLKSSDDVLILDFCTASTTAEVSRLWEAWESLVLTNVDKSTGCNSIVLEAVCFPVTEKGNSLFFPKKSFGVRSSVSTQVMVDLVHYGVSSLEMPFKDIV